MKKLLIAIMLIVSFAAMLFSLREILNWNKDNKYCTLNVDLTTSKSTIEYIDDNGNVAIYNI